LAQQVQSTFFVIQHLMQCLINLPYDNTLEVKILSLYFHIAS